MITKELIQTLENAKHLCIFTGAGISAESGIPTFRDTISGLWENFNVEEIASVEAFKKNKDLWFWYEARRRDIMNVHPNAAHIAIAKMAKKLKITVITQNVDDLHERALLEENADVELIHLHGTLNQPRCFNDACAEPYCYTNEDDFNENAHAPVCLKCGDSIRPGVVWFNELLPDDLWERAKQSSINCDVMLVIGTSLEVYPASELPYLARLNGATCINVNPTIAQEHLFQFKIVGKAAELLPKLNDAFN
jgi:NAD-dependent deacetylase